MKKTFAAIFAALLLMPFVADSSAAKAQTYIDSMVTSHINSRRREYVYKSRSHWRKKSPRKYAKRKIARRVRHRG